MKKRSVIVALFALMAARDVRGQEIAIEGPIEFHTPWPPPPKIGVGGGMAFFSGATLASRGARPHPAQVGTFAGEGQLVWTLVGGRFGPAASVDFEIGGAIPAGFAHGIHLEPLGVGVRIGRLGYAAATAGGGAGGITGSVPFALEVPASGHVAIDVSSRVRLLLAARLFWTSAAARRDGAPHAPFADEVRLGIGARVGRTWDSDRFADAGGYFFRLEHAERMGATYVGLAFGWELGGLY
jgi:hypothetical protein